MNTTIKSYKELIVWQKSIDLVTDIYRITALLPKEELYGLASQMRRAAVSIPSNIAEGYKRKGLGDYLRFLSFSDASAAELETQLIILKNLYTEIDCKEIESKLIEIQKMLFSMSKKLDSQISR